MPNMANKRKHSVNLSEERKKKARAESAKKAKEASQSGVLKYTKKK